jgi:cytochrome c
MRTSLLVAGLVFTLAACQGSTRHSESADHTYRSDSAPTTAAGQIERGRGVFAQNCAKCHGKSGEGTDDAPKLVGAGALPVEPRADQKRDVRFHTAQDVVNFAMKNMPPKASDRAKLEPEAYWCVIAFALDANGVELRQPLGAANASSIDLHR